MRRAWKFVLAVTAFSHFSSVDAILGGRFAAIPPYNDPVVFVNHVGRFSRIEGYQNPSTGFYTFRGIRYADPPVRENRFLRPRFKRLSGDINAKFNAPPCPQPDYYDENKIIGEEDCLALNIFTPQMPDESTGLPVLLWIHGGGFRYGSAAQYGAESLIQNGVIFVSIQYRLGSLGILGDGSKEFGGNVAMFDMNAALQWVTEYIKFFGGDPKQIKVVGHGSGAQSAMYLSTSPMGRSGINGVMAMSGSSLSQYSYDDNATLSTEEVASAHNCPHKDEMELLSCLRKKSLEEIVKTDSKLQIERLMDRNMVKSMSGLLSFSPNIESKDDQRSLPGLITSKPEDSLEREPDRKIPLLIGVTKHETASGINANEIVRIFKTGSEFLKSAAKTLQLKNILKATKQAASALGALGLPTLDDYLSADDLSPEKLYAKLVETTTDVFFNVPSVLTAELWGKWQQKAFFYQFDYVGKGEPSGRHFLKPLPLVSKQAGAKGQVSHGDELGYLFDVHDVFGNKINGTNVNSPRDVKARENFMKLITKFAYMNATSGDFSINDQITPAFRADGGNFIKVSDTLSFEKDFRFCQLSMFGAPLQSSKKITCEFLAEGLKKLPASFQKVKEVGGGLLKGSKLGF